MQTLLAYFMGGFKSEEYFNLYHDTDLTCNEVWNFTCKIFDDPESFYDHSVSLARHLYETGMHPQIKSGEFYVVYFTDCRFGGETVDAVGLFKSDVLRHLDMSEGVIADFTTEMYAMRQCAAASGRGELDKGHEDTLRCALSLVFSVHGKIRSAASAARWMTRSVPGSSPEAWCLPAD